MSRIALDAMGGDLAPAATVTGALLALGEFGGAHTIQLVGREDVIRAELARQLAGEFRALAAQAPDIEIVHAKDVIEMTDKPSVAVRGKRNSSMVVGLRLQADGKSDGFVSAGNTGAQMAASTFILKLHEGLTRPAIGTLFPTALDVIVVVDSGANVDCSAQELMQFARLGAVYAEDLLGRQNPSVGLLSIGEEPSKGNAVVKEAHALLMDARREGLNFHGNVEGRDLPLGASAHGRIDVVVCDGFVGNVLLKFYESISPMIVGLLKKHGVTGHKLTGALHHLDYAAVGGAPLLGVQGVSIIAHGKSSPEAIKNAVRVAARAIESRMSEHIGMRLASRTAKKQGAA
ncbi:MAG TPA: phosphate acyltransferase PlsX [Gemmatimonadaceae bacterium]|nr:phosphate acyltransferase PlsX [Gemmatimonadaceae bacterium]